MLAIRLPEALEERLERLARGPGWPRPRSRARAQPSRNTWTTCCSPRPVPAATARPSPLN